MINTAALHRRDELGKAMRVGKFKVNACLECLDAGIAAIRRLGSRFAPAARP